MLINKLGWNSSGIKKCPVPSMNSCTMLASIEGKSNMLSTLTHTRSEPPIYQESWVLTAMQFSKMLRYSGKNDRTSSCNSIFNHLGENSKYHPNMSAAYHNTAIVSKEKAHDWQAIATRLTWLTDTLKNKQKPVI